jgi:hypothetical protein
VKKHNGHIDGWCRALRESFRAYDERQQEDGLIAPEPPVRVPAGIRNGRRSLYTIDRAFARDGIPQSYYEQLNVLFTYRHPAQSAEMYIQWVDHQPCRKKARNAKTKKRYQSAKKRKEPCAKQKLTKKTPCAHGVFPIFTGLT